jgi:hypothetical protein
MDESQVNNSQTESLLFLLLYPYFYCLIHCQANLVAFIWLIKANQPLKLFINFMGETNRETNFINKVSESHGERE